MYFKGNIPIILCNLIVQVDIYLTTHKVINLFLFAWILHSQQRLHKRGGVSSFKDTFCYCQESGPRKTSFPFTAAQAPSGRFCLAAQEPPALNLIIIYKNLKVLYHLPPSKCHSSSSYSKNQRLEVKRMIPKNPSNSDPSPIQEKKALKSAWGFWPTTGTVSLFFQTKKKPGQATAKCLFFLTCKLAWKTRY